MTISQENTLKNLQWSNSNDAYRYVFILHIVITSSNDFTQKNVVVFVCCM